MIRYPTITRVKVLHARAIAESGGATGVRDQALLESSLAQPLQTFGGKDLYPSLIAKAAALAFFLVSNHPFVDGNKRVGHAVMETFLYENGFEMTASVDEQEQMILALAAGELDREAFTAWVNTHVVERSTP